MNIHVGQSIEAQTELRLLSASKYKIISAQSSKPNMCIVQDSLLGAYKMTCGNKRIRKDQFFDISMKLEMTVSELMKKIKIIKTVAKEKGKNLIYKAKRKGKITEYYSCKALMSLALPVDFNYEKENKADPEEPVVRIYKGVLYEGALDKSTLGAATNSLIHIIHKEYGPDITAKFIDSVQFITNNWLMIDGFSIGIEDCMTKNKNQTQEIKDVIKKCFIEAEFIKETTTHPGIREVRITGILNKARDMSLKKAKDSIDPKNNFLSTVNSGSKGDFFNVAQITGLLGQQNLQGKRIVPTLNNGNRTLPHYPFENLPIDLEYESRGFIDSSFIRGLEPRQFYFHAMSGREGCCDKRLCHKQVAAIMVFCHTIIDKQCKTKETYNYLVNVFYWRDPLVAGSPLEL